MALTLTTLGLAGLLSLTACSGGAPVDVSDEAYALQAVGLETGLEQAAPAPSASAAGRADRNGVRRPAVRKYLRENTLHGEMTVQGKNGVRTIVVQRGTVTAVDAGTLSVKSSDGFALTWTLGEKLKVVQNREKVDAGAVKVGAAVGVAGDKDGTATTARLVAIG
jgi:hypothetical protein